MQDLGRPTFSVLLPAFNGEAVLSDALDSLIGQTRTDWEAVVVDDGSTDSTAEVARSYAARDERITVIVKPNGGTSSARNTAGRVASGRYFALLDQDDYYLPSFFERIGVFIEAHEGYDIYSCDALYCSDDGQLVKRPQSPEGITVYTIEDLVEGCCIHPQAVFRREVFETLGGFDEDPLCWTEDYDFWLRALCLGFRHIYDPEPLAVYRWSASQKTSSAVRCVESDAYILRKLVDSGCLRGRILRRARQRARIQARAAVVIGDPARIELERRVAAGDLSGFRRLYLASYRGWASPLKYVAALPLAMISPRSMSRLLASRAAR